MTTFEKLIKRIKDDLDIEIDSNTLSRTYAGYWQRMNGAVVWSGYIKNTLCVIGSVYSATELINAKAPLVLSQKDSNFVEVYPDE